MWLNIKEIAGLIHFHMTSDPYENTRIEGKTRAPADGYIYQLFFKDKCWVAVLSDAQLAKRLSLFTAASEAQSITLHVNHSL